MGDSLSQSPSAPWQFSGAGFDHGPALKIAPGASPFPLPPEFNLAGAFI